MEPTGVHTDVVIVGGGPAGTATAIFLAEQGLGSVIVEREDFPRFHTGEALTGSVGKMLRQLGLGEAMAACGFPVKNGGVVVGTNGRNSFTVPAVDALADGTRELSTTWQVRRADFDALLLDAALERGATRCRGRATGVVTAEDGRVVGVDVDQEDGSSLRITSDVVVDASGMGCFLHRAGVTGPKERGSYDAQIALFSHLSGAHKDPDGTAEPGGIDNTVIIYRERNQWAWFIPVDGDTVSVGVIVPTRVFRSRPGDAETFFDAMLRELNPALERRTRDAQRVMPVMTAANYSYRIRQFAGPGWICVGDSHRFIDPIFAYGVHFSMFEGRMAAEAIAAARGGDETAFDRYQARADAGQDIVQDLIDAFWNEPLAFGYLIHKRHRDDIIDLFAGRIYDIDEPSAGLAALRRINAHAAPAADR